MEPKIKVTVAEKKLTIREWANIIVGSALLLFVFASCSYRALKPTTCGEAMAARSEADAKADSAVSWGMRSNASDENKTDAESAIRKQQETLYDEGNACH